MGWFGKFLTSSIGQKVIMSLTGLFLVVFLVVHLSGNLQLLIDDNGEAFNTYAYFMTHNPFIKTVSWGLYAFILLHAVQGIALALKNRAARSSRYAVTTTRAVSTNAFAAKSMAWLGILIAIFLVIHMGDFWYKMKFTDQLAMVTYDGADQPVKNLFARVDAAYQQWWLVAIYVLSMIALAAHLLHGFQSAFQTLGLNHKKYTPFIQGLGKVYAILIPLGFAMIPILYFLGIRPF